MEKPVLAGRALSVFAGEKETNNLQMSLYRIRSSFLGFTVCVGKIFSLPKVIKIASFIHEKVERGNFLKSLFPSIPLLWHRTFTLREMDKLRFFESLGQTGSNKSKVKQLQTKAAAEQGCGGGNNAWLSRKL